MTLRLELHHSIVSKLHAFGLMLFPLQVSLQHFAGQVLLLFLLVSDFLMKMRNLLNFHLALLLCHLSRNSNFLQKSLLLLG